MPRVAGAATSAAHPARNAGQISLKLSSDQPGTAPHATCVYFAGSDGNDGWGGVEGDAWGGDAGTGADGRAVSGVRGEVVQPARIVSAARRIAAARADCVARERSKGREERDKMLWFFLEALVALLIAVAIVMWTMRPHRKPPSTPDDGDRDDRP